MAGPTSKTPVWRGKNYDGNGKLSPTELAQGMKVENNRIVGGKFKRLATIEDSSATKQLAETDELKKDNVSLKKQLQDSLLVIKDLDKRLKKMEDGK